MSRSRPTDHAPNPAVRWFEWTGESGSVRYYDRDTKTNITVPLPFSFLLLDQLATVKGWHEASQSGIYANEVRDTRRDVLVVKSFKEGTIAEGLYAAIKDRVNVAGGRFVANCYIAFKRDDALVLGSIRFKGAALGAWMEFTKAHRAELYKKAIDITGYTEGKKGRVIYRVPTFALRDVSESTSQIALALDAELQAYLDAYLARTTREQVETASTPVHDDADVDAAFTEPPDDSDIPF